MSLPTDRPLFPDNKRAGAFVQLNPTLTLRLCTSDKESNCATQTSTLHRDDSKSAHCYKQKGCRCHPSTQGLSRVHSPPPNFPRFTHNECVVRPGGQVSKGTQKNCHLWSQNLKCFSLEECINPHERNTSPIRRQLPWRGQVLFNRLDLLVCSS